MPFRIVCSGGAVHMYDFVAWVENDIFIRWRKELSQEKNAFAKFGPTCRKSVGKITWIFDQRRYEHYLPIIVELMKKST